MTVDKLTANVTLRRKPKSGEDAYELMLQSLEAEIEEKQGIVDELKNTDVKQNFIEQWHEGIRNVNVFSAQ